MGLNPWGQYKLDGHPKDSIVLRRARHHLLHALLSSLIFTCKNCLDWDILRYFYFFTKYIALLSLIVNKNEVFIYNMKNISLSFCSILYDIFNWYTCKKRNEKWVLRLCNFLIKKMLVKLVHFWIIEPQRSIGGFHYFGGRGGGRLWHWALSFF